jgi:hypothetical protein
MAMLPGIIRRYGTESRMSKFIRIMSRFFIDSLNRTADLNVQFA